MRSALKELRLIVREPSRTGSNNQVTDGQDILVGKGKGNLKDVFLV